MIFSIHRFHASAEATLCEATRAVNRVDCVRGTHEAHVGVCVASTLAGSRTGTAGPLMRGCFVAFCASTPLDFEWSGNHVAVDAAGRAFARGLVCIPTGWGSARVNEFSMCMPASWVSTACCS